MSKRVCPSCNAPVREHARFCPECGHRLPPADSYPAEGTTIEVPRQQRSGEQVPPGRPPARAEPPVEQPGRYESPAPPAAPPGRPEPSDPAATQVGRYSRPAAPPTQEGRYDRPTQPSPAARPQPPAPRHSTARPARPAPPPPPEEEQYGYPPPARQRRYEPLPEEQFEYEEPRRASRLPFVLLGLLALAIMAALALLVFQQLGQRSPQVAQPSTTPVSRLPTVTPAGENGNGGSKLILSDNFDTRTRSGWPEEEVDGGAFEFRDGAYRIAVDQQTKILWTSTNEPYGDFDVAIDMTPLRGTDSELAGGLVLREQKQEAGESRFYAFQVRPDGTYAFRKSVGNGQWEHIIDWESSEVIRAGQGQTNRLRVVARGATYELYINDQLVNTVQDGTYMQGFVGFGASTFMEGGALIAFDNFELREP